MSTDANTSDREFVSNLRTAVDAYLEAVDRWEAAYQKHYRMPDNSEKVRSDMEAEHKLYRERRRELEAFLPRARRLCLKYDLREPFSGLMRVSLGNFAPQQRIDSAIGRGERNTVTICLCELHDKCTEWTAEESEKKSNRSLLGRVLDFFY